MKNFFLLAILGIFLVSSVSAVCYEFDNTDYPPSHSHSKLCSDLNLDNGYASFSCQGTEFRISSGEPSCSEDGCSGTKLDKNYKYYFDEGANNFCGSCWDIDYREGYYSWVYSLICWDVNYIPEVECDPDWECTAWSDQFCGVEGVDMETRSCTELNGCYDYHNTPDRPPTTRECGSSSFSFDFFEWIWNWIKSLFSGTGSLDSSSSYVSSYGGKGGGVY